MFDFSSEAFSWGFAWGWLFGGVAVVVFYLFFAGARQENEYPKNLHADSNKSEARVSSFLGLTYEWTGDFDPRQLKLIIYNALNLRLGISITEDELAKVLSDDTIKSCLITPYSDDTFYWEKVFTYEYKPLFKLRCEGTFGPTSQKRYKLFAL